MLVETLAISVCPTDLLARFQKPDLSLMRAATAVRLGRLLVQQKT